LAEAFLKGSFDEAFTKSFFFDKIFHKSFHALMYIYYSKKIIKGYTSAQTKLLAQNPQ